MTPPQPMDPGRQEAGEDKKEAVNKLERQLREWEVELDRIKDSVMKASEDVRRDVDRELGRSDEHRANLERQVEKMKQEGEETWREVQRRAEEAARELKRSIDEMMAKMR